MIIEMLNRLEATSGRNDKINMLVECLEGSSTFYNTCRLALDSLIRFGIRNWPSFEEVEYITVDFDDTLSMIEQLSGMNHSQQLIDDIAMLYNHCDPSEREVVKRILMKDLRCGVQVATINKAIELCNKKYNTNYEKIFDYPCMLTSAYDQKKADKLFALKDGEQLYCQQKCDGMRFNAVVESNGNVGFYGRSGKPIEIPDDRFVEIFRHLAGSEDMVFDGELLIDGTADGDAIERSTGNGILNKAVRGTMDADDAARVTAVLWDEIPLNEFRVGKSTKKYHDRFTSLIERLKGKNLNRVFPVLTWMITNKLEANKLFIEMVEHGREGVIIKSPNNIWKNVRATDTLKLKAENDVDLLCTDWEPGSKRFEGMLGAIVCQSRDGKVVVKVGTGFTEEQRSTIKKEDIVGKIVTVTYNLRIKDKNRPDVDSLFLPRFVEIREDKDVADSSENIK